MSDLIDRQAALDAIRPLQTYKLFEGDDMILVDKAEVQTELMMLPFAQPERKRAKWIATTSLQEGQITWRDYKCSNCSHHRSKPMNYCEVCGAKMER